MAGRPSCSAIAHGAFSRPNLSVETQSEQGDVGDTLPPQGSESCDGAACARSHVVAPTAEVVAYSTAQHAVASLHGVATRLHGDQRAAIASSLLDLSTLYDADERAPSHHGDNHNAAPLALGG